MKRLGKTAALAAFGAVLVMSGLAAQNASAHEPHPGLEFSIGVRGVPGCNTRASDVTCTLPSGQNFVLEVGLDALPDDIPSYEGFDIYLTYAGVTPLQDASTDDWPECGFPASSYERTGIIGFACARGVPPAGPSSYIGPIGTNSFTCSQSGSISLVHSTEGNTDLVQGMEPGPTPDESVGVNHAEGADTEETLTITCGSVPAGTPGIVTEGTPGPEGPTPGQLRTPIPGGSTTPGEEGQTLEPAAAANATGTAIVKATATAKAKGTPDDGQIAEEDDDDSNTWIWIVIGVAVAVIVVGAAGGGYWYMRNRAGGSGGTPTGGGGSAPSSGAPTSGGAAT